ncbi:MAG: PIG-L family deacetylase [Selenomonadaceae bacterium]|nr:PIG-L family deacetylase [Selenomonadaceae bacterium]
MKILILAPHQDDEIILCGSFMKRLVDKGHDIFVVFTTNGNYEIAVHTVRLEEALKVLSMYGLPENHVIFMGYANEYDINEPHIYNAPKEAELHSQYGVGETYGLPEHAEYSFQKYGVHHRYTRGNFVGDLYEIIDEIRPDLIFATGEEIHPDHSANSLFLDEVLGKLLNEDKNYRPIVLKKPEYSTAWFGPEDFSEKENPPAIFDYKNPYVFVNEHRSWFYDPYIRWKDRISIPADKEASVFVKKALELYASQNAVAHFTMLLNSDVVFWLRRTDSLTYGADIVCSSGNAWFLHDFKRNDTTDLKRKKTEVWKQDASIWRPDSNDERPFIEMDFKVKRSVKEVVIYQEFCPRCAVTDCRLEDDCGREIWRGALEKKRATVIRNIRVETKSLTVKIEKCTDRSVYQPGITEIEVFSDDASVDWIKEICE